MAVAQEAAQVRRLSLSGPAPEGGGITATTADMAAGVRRLEDAGFDYAGAGDTVWGDTYAQLALEAYATERISFVPTATNPVSRHPVITASAIATVDEISFGRTNLGIGTGNSGVAMTGLPGPGRDPQYFASWADMRRAITIISSAHRRAREFEPWPPGVEIDESVIELHWVRRRVPILVAAGGPKGGRVAAEMGDGILFRAGDLAWDEYPQRFDQLRQWRAQSPRTGDPFEIQLTIPSFITDSVEEGREMLGPVVSAMAYASMRESLFPSELIEPWKVFKAGYDFAHHVSSVNLVNVELMDKLGLADYFFERYALIGSEDALVDRLIDFQTTGFTAVTIGGGAFDRDVAQEQFDRAVKVRNKYLQRVGPHAVTTGFLAGTVSDALLDRFRAPRAVPR